ncbi:hypothetical protein CROQUDRAFT_39760, partial [Cronartium quercuum f. sp. fusiforme G11]
YICATILDPCLKMHFWKTMENFLLTQYGITSIDIEQVYFASKPRKLRYIQSQILITQPKHFFTQQFTEHTTKKFGRRDIWGPTGSTRIRS